jgi:hypothetical protein
VRLESLEWSRDILPSMLRTADAGGISGEGIGAACVTRTRDPIITNDVLYQLS